MVMKDLFFFGAAVAAAILYLEARYELKEARKEALLLHEQRKQEKKQEEEMQRRGLCILCGSGRRNKYKYKETSVWCLIINSYAL